MVFYVNNCIPTCGECNKPLNGSIIEVEGKRIHTTCFNCEVCHKILDGGYFPSPLTQEKPPQEVLSKISKCKRSAYFCNGCY